MRSTPGLSILTAPAGFRMYAYMRVRNYDPSGMGMGDWVNLGAIAVGAYTIDFTNTLSTTDDIDRNTLSLSATFAREHGNASLVPFRSDSTLNATDGLYQPLLDLNRAWEIWGAVVPIGTVLAESDMRPWAAGYVDRIEIAGEPAVITVQARGMEAALIDERIVWTDATETVPISKGTPKVYPGGDLQTTLQYILDEQMGAGVIPLTVDPSCPSYFVNGWNQETDVGLFDLLTQTAALSGASLRYRYDSSDALTLTVYAVNRSPTSTDYSIGPDVGGYESLDVAIDKNGIRNDVIVRYVDTNFGEQFVRAPVDGLSASRSRFGHRVFPIDLGADTRVITQAAAGALADAVQADLQFPPVEHQARAVGYWFAELGDYVALLANNVHYNEDQAGGVVGITQSFENGVLTSTLSFRGTPAGRYRTWLTFAPSAPRTPFTPAVTSLSAWFYEVTFIFRDAFVGWIANVNQYTRSVMAELSTTDDFAVVLDTKYADVVNGAAAGDFAGVTRDQVYYVRVTPYSGPLDLGLPTGVAGLPVIDSTFVQYEVPDKPSFDVLQSDVATLTSDLATETADRIAGDAATLASAEAYTDAKVAGLSWKQAVRAATTVAGTLASSFENGDAIDGVTLATGNRILIKNQSSGAENGIYVVNASGAPTRATDADSGAELVNATCYVSEGTTNADTQWTCTTNATITLGSTSLAFAQLATGSVGTQTANTVYAGPTSGGVALPTFRALVAADIPSLDAAKIISGVIDVLRLGTGTPSSATYLRGDGTWSAISASALWRVDVTRTVSVTVNDTVEIGSWSARAGGHIVTVAWSQANAVGTKMYWIPTTYDATAGAWQLCYPAGASVNGAADLELEIKVDTTNTAFRLRRTVVGLTGTIAASVTLQYGGDAAPTFTASTTTSTSAITARYGDRFLLSGLSQSGASDGQVATWNDTLKKYEPATPVPINPAFVALTDAATVTWATSGAKVNNATLTIGGNRTLSITGAVAGAEGYLEVTQDGTGSRTLTLPAGTVVGATTSLGPTASKKTAIAWSYNGSAFTFVLARES